MIAVEDLLQFVCDFYMAGVFVGEIVIGITKEDCL